MNVIIYTQDNGTVAIITPTGEHKETKCKE